MAKQPIIVVSRKQVEKDIQRERDKGKSHLEAAYSVMGNAYKGLSEASAGNEALIRKAKGYRNFDDDQKEKYDSICRSVIEPETQRIGHCKNIIAELTKPK